MSTDPITDRYQQAISQLYENERLTDALTDESAQHLLGWAEQQIQTLAAAKTDPAAFDEATAQLQRVVRAINRLVEQQTGLTADELVERLAGMVKQAVEIYYPLSPEDEQAVYAAIDDLVKQLPTYTESELVAHLVELAGQAMQLFQRPRAASPASPPAGETPPASREEAPDNITAPPTQNDQVPNSAKVDLNDQKELGRPEE